jgi:hypothetical protein
MVLKERERVALQQVWQLKKELERAGKLIAKGAERRLGPLGRMKLAAKVNRVLRGPVVTPAIHLEPVRQDHDG